MFTLKKAKDNLKSTQDLSDRPKVVVISVPSDTDIPPVPHNSTVTALDSPPPMEASSKNKVGEPLSPLELEARIFGDSSDDEDEIDRFYKRDSQISQHSRYSETSNVHFGCSPVLVLIIIIDVSSLKSLSNIEIIEICKAQGNHSITRLYKMIHTANYHYPHRLSQYPAV